MQNCEKYEELIMLFPDGFLTQEENDDILTHIKECEDCLQLFNNINNIYENTFIENKPMPSFLHARILEEVKKEKIAHVVQYHPKFSTKAILYMASAIALIVLTSGVLGTFFGTLNNSSDDAGAIISDMAQMPQAEASDSAATGAASEEAAVADVVPRDATPEMSNFDSTDAAVEDEEAAVTTEGTNLHEIILPTKLATESYAFFLIAEVSEYPTFIEGEVLLTDKETGTSYVLIENNMVLLESLINELEKAEASLLMPEQIENSIDLNSKHGILIIINN